MDIKPMVWLRDLARRSVARVLTTRPIPSHVAFIMDGNRRFAESHHIKILQGHTFGYNRLIQALEWCLDLGITCVSVYAFSIDNYNRSQEEVATLMRLAEEKLTHMLAEQDILHKHAVQVRVIGDLSLAPPSVCAAADAIMTATKHHSGAIFNICFSYTSSRELLHAMDTTSSLAAENTPACIDDGLYTSDCPQVDLLIRTSGESRLSDFMLRQSSHALLVFTKVLWPEFSFLDFASAVLEYQRCHGTLHAARFASHNAVCRAAHAVAAETHALTTTPAVAATAAAMGVAETMNKGTYVDDLRGALGQLSPIRTKAQGASESPVGIATPGAVSSPSSQSDASSSSPRPRRTSNPSSEEIVLNSPLIQKVGDQTSDLVRRGRRSLMEDLPCDIIK